MLLKECLGSTKSSFQQLRHGIVYIKESSSTAEREITLVRDDLWQPPPDELPPTVTPSGLSAERKQYLYEKIREFCPNDKKILYALSLKTTYFFA